MTPTAAPNPPTRRYVPKQLDVAQFEQLEPLYNELIARTIGSPEQLEKWLADFSELTTVVDEYGTRRYIDKSCHTDDKEIEKAFLHFVENVEPRIKPLYFQLQKKLLDSPHRHALRAQRHQILQKKWQADVEIFRDENVALETQVTKTVNDYDKLSGAMMISYRGKEYTLQQAARFLEEPDRTVRKDVWELIAKRRMQDREAIEGIFETLLPMRQQIAANAGMADYRAHVWKAYKRFDYTPDDCLRFADSVEKTCVPVVKALDRQRKADLQIDSLRPWDGSVDPQNRPPLRPFKEDQVEEFVEKTQTIFDRMSPELAQDFKFIRARNNLDLVSRKGKQPGGYQTSLDEIREPFIFMNAAGMQRDVEVLLHEGGHAFHMLAARDEPLVFLRSAPMEFCEVASMSMELLGCEHFDVFYSNAAESARAKRSMLEGVIRVLSWIATIDSFQHWLYTHPGHTREQRTRAWIDLLNRFGGETDWSGYEDIREAMWQRQLHLFHAPFYYIEYGIAQLGALQLWMKSKEDPHRAIANYRAGLKLGGTRSLPDLFTAAGIQFDFSQKTLGPLMDSIARELDSLPR